MASISIVDLFVALENQVGKDALLCAFAAYSGAPSTPAKAVAVPPVPGAPVKVRKPQSEETKAAAALKRAATKAANAIAAAGDKPAEPVVAAPAAAAPAAAAPADAPAAAEEKPKKVLSKEQKEKMAAGRAAAKAKKEAAAAAAPSAAAAAAPSAADAVPVADAVPAPEADGNASDTSSQKRRGPKKLSEMSPEERAAHDKKVAERKLAKAAAPAAAAVPLPASPAPVAAAADENGPTVFAPFTHKGVSYLRNMRGDLLTEEYEWVGRYNSATKTIDTKFAKPVDLEDE